MAVMKMLLRKVWRFMVVLLYTNESIVLDTRLVICSLPHVAWLVCL